MADQLPPEDETPVTDAPVPDVPVSDAQFTDPAHDPVRAALRDLTFLVPGTPDDVAPDDLAPDADRMPEDAWERLRLALGQESAQRAAATHDNVVLIGAPTPSTTPTSTATPAPTRGRGMRWAGGLVAASVAVLAVGVGVQVVRGGAQDVAVTAGGEATASVAASAAAKAAAAPSLEAAGAAEAAPLSAAPAPTSTVGTTPPVAADSRSAGPAPVARAARMVKASNTNYTKDALAAQVTSLLDSVNVHSAQEAALMPEEPVALPIEGGFTQTWQALRDCLTWLAKSGAAQALVVDRATYEGADAGIVVSPAGLVDPATSPPPTAVVPTPMGILDVWVVKPECQKAQDGLVQHLPYTWQR